MRTGSRTRIINISLELFSETGFANTSVREIAREVGMRESSLYNHFKSKDEILAEIIAAYKAYKSENTIVTDELLARLEDPLIFLHQLADKLVRIWNTDYEKKIFRLVLMEQFREINGKKISAGSLIDDIRSILWMIFDELIQYRVVKQCNPQLLTNEFLHPLFFIRLELLTTDENKLSHALDLTKKHVDFFWESIKVS
ncbi:MAG: helix-turn-helix domain-containing protein [bacterium]